MTGTREGFSLIEAIAALLIAAMVLLAAYSLQRQMTSAEGRYERALSLAERKRSVIVLVRDVNPAAEPRGERALAAGRRAVWTARPVGDWAQAAGGLHDVRLYQMRITLLEADGRPAATMAFDRVGWRPLSGARPASSRSAAGSP